MNLAIDIGNTNMKFGLFEKNKLKQVFEEKKSLSAIIAEHKIEAAIISKSGSDNKVEKILKQKKIKTLILSTDLKLPMDINYQTPHTLGADRIAGSVAARFLFRNKNVLKIDFGTCITYDFINKKNQYLGGAISPGMLMRFKALHQYTANLPLVDFKLLKPGRLIGTDTSTSIVSGVMNGITEEVNGTIKQYKKRFDNLKIVATGGDLLLFATVSKYEIFARPYLVLEGMNQILNYNL